MLVAIDDEDLVIRPVVGEQGDAIQGAVAGAALENRMETSRRLIAMPLSIACSDASSWPDSIQ